MIFFDLPVGFEFFIGMKNPIFTPLVEGLKVIKSKNKAAQWAQRVGFSREMMLPTVFSKYREGRYWIATGPYGSGRLAQHRQVAAPCGYTLEASITEAIVSG